MEHQNWVRQAGFKRSMASSKVIGTSSIEELIHRSRDSTTDFAKETSALGDSWVDMDSSYDLWVEQ